MKQTSIVVTLAACVAILAGCGAASSASNASATPTPHAISAASSSVASGRCAAAAQGELVSIANRIYQQAVSGRNGADVQLDGKSMTLTTGGDTIKLTEGTPGRTGAPSTPPPTVGTEWVLDSTVSAAGTASSIPTDVERPTLLFKQDGTATIFAGCNHGHGPAKVGDDGFATFGAIAMTRMHCSDDANALERTVLRVLDGKVALGHQGADLSLAKNGEHLVYRGG